MVIRQCTHMVQLTSFKNFDVLQECFKVLYVLVELILVSKLAFLDIIFTISPIRFLNILANRN